MTPDNPTPEEMQKLLTEITARVGNDGTHDEKWDYRDVWLAKCASYIRFLEFYNRILLDQIRDSEARSVHFI